MSKGLAEWPGDRPGQHSSQPQAPGNPRWTDLLLGCESCRMGSEILHEVSGEAPPPPFHSAFAISKQREAGRRPKES